MNNTGMRRRLRFGGRLNHLLGELRGSPARGKDAAPTIRIALAGNPNAGKTSIFNSLTGQHQHIGNYPGVTVEKKTGVVYHRGYKIEIVDLPGTYSLTAYSPEEVVTRDYVLKDKPDLIVDVIDSTNLERNLYLCMQFQELGVPVVGALNMTDEAEAKGTLIDEKQLSRLLDIPFVKTVGTHGSGIRELLDVVVDTATGKAGQQRRTLNYGRELEGEIGKLLKVLEQDPDFAKVYSLRWMAVKLLEADKDAIQKLRAEHKAPQEVLKQAEESREWIRRHFHDDSVVVVGEQRYAYIHGAVRETVGVRKRSDRRTITENLDRIILNRYAGVFIFFLMMFLVYQLTFAIGNPLSDLIDKGFSSLGNYVSGIIPPGAVHDMLVNGIIGGVGGVIVFLPIVLLLFMSLSFLEDSGYMARAAFVMDKFFHLFGMHGRSFIPFMVATGCAVPAVLSARTLVNPRDRKITILVTPMMMCGAKSPVVAMLAAAFFPRSAGMVFWLVWFSGWMIAFVTAFTFRKILFRGDTAPFVMELPPYRLPTWRGIATHIWDRSSMYLRKAGTIILGVSIVIWFLLYYPKPSEYTIDYKAETAKINAALSQSVINEDGTVSLSEEDRQPTREELKNELVKLNQLKAGEEIRASFAGQVGKFIEPLFQPLGFDWRISIGLFAGFAAKEVIISTLGIVYGIGEADPTSEGGSIAKTPLKEHLSTDPRYNPAMALALMFFVLIYVPCMAVMAVVKKELGSWKWPLFLAVYTFVVAWGVAFIVYNIAGLLGLAA